MASLSESWKEDLTFVRHLFLDKKTLIKDPTKDT